MFTPTWNAPDLTSADLRACAAWCQEDLTAWLDADWTTLAFDMEWSCRRTLDHVVDVMFFYAAHLSTRATSRLTPPRDGDPAKTPAELLQILQSAAAILGDVANGAVDGARGFHNSGMTDATGFLAMGCEEILMHTDDILRAFGQESPRRDEIAARVLARIFPWAPADVPAWDALRWSAGRIALPGHPRLDSLWSWHPAPLTEWDGTIRRRTIPAAWR